MIVGGDLLLQRRVCVCVCVCMCVCIHISKTFLFPRGKLFLYSLNVRLLISSKFSPNGKFLFFHASPDTGEGLSRVTQAGAGGLASSLSWPAPGAWPGVRLLFIPAEVLSLFALALLPYTLEPRAVHEVCPRALKPMSWRLGREHVSLNFWVNSMFFPRA